MLYAAWCSPLKQGSNVRTGIRRKRKQAAKTVRDYSGYTNTHQQRLNERQRSRQTFQGRINMGVASWADGGWQSFTWTYRWHWLCSILLICHLPPRLGHYWIIWGQKEGPQPAKRWLLWGATSHQQLQSYLIFSRDKQKIGKYISNKCFRVEIMKRFFCWRWV